MSSTGKEFQDKSEPNEPPLSVKRPPDQRVPGPETLGAEGMLGLFFLLLKKHHRGRCDSARA